MPDREKVIEGLENLKETIRTATQYTFTSGGICAMSMKRIDNAIALLKEQEIGHWIYLENCSNSGVYCSECHTKVFDNYPFKKKFSYFCPHCGTRMEGETERR